MKYNTWYYGKGVIGAAYPWCVVFVSWCARAAQISTQILPNAKSTSALRSFARETGRYHENDGTFSPKKGDIMFESAHVGIVVEDAQGNFFVTVEGNSSDAVSLRTRSLSDSNVKGFYTMDLPLGEDEEVTTQAVEHTGDVSPPIRALAQTASSKDGIYLKCSDGFVAPITLRAEWTTRLNGASKVEARVQKSGSLSFQVGSELQVIMDGKSVFLGIVFVRKHSETDSITLVAYDVLRYLENSVIMALPEQTIAQRTKTLCQACALETGVFDSPELLLAPRLALQETCRKVLIDSLNELREKAGSQCFLSGDGGRVSIVRAFNSGILIGEGDTIRLDCSTSIDSGFADSAWVWSSGGSAIKVHIETDEALVKQYGLLNVIQKAPSDAQETAKALLAQSCTPTRTAYLSRLNSQSALKAGAKARVRLDLGDGVKETDVLIRFARHTFAEGRRLMDVEFDF